MKHIILMCFYLKAFPNLQKIGGLEFVSLGHSTGHKNSIYYNKKTQKMVKKDTKKSIFKMDFEFKKKYIANFTYRNQLCTVKQSKMLMRYTEDTNLYIIPKGSNCRASKHNLKVIRLVYNYKRLIP